MLDMISTLVDFHDQKTEKKQRIFKLLAADDFPFVEV